MWRHLPYGITQCHLPPDTSECAPPNPSQKGWYSINLPRGDERLSDLDSWLLCICLQTVTHASINRAGRFALLWCWASDIPGVLSWCYDVNIMMFDVVQCTCTNCNCYWPVCCRNAVSQELPYSYNSVCSWACLQRHFSTQNTPARRNTGPERDPDRHVNCYWTLSHCWPSFQNNSIVFMCCMLHMYN